MYRFLFVKNKIVLIFILSTLFLFASLYKSNEEIFVRTVNIICESDLLKKQAECLEEKILDRLEESPTMAKGIFDTIWELSEKGKFTGDVRYISPIIHKAGMILAEEKKSFNEAVQFCPVSFRGGCIHGAIMEFVDNQYTEIDPNKLTKDCILLAKENSNNEFIYKNCIHAVGHIFVAKSKMNLNETLLLCNFVPKFYVNDCLYGALMESSKGESAQDYHSEEPVGKHDPNCLVIDDKFKKVCYISLGFYRQYEAGSEPWENTYRTCAKVLQAYIKNCIDGVGGALLFSQAMSIKKAQGVCLSLPEDVQKDCLNSF